MKAICHLSGIQFETSACGFIQSNPQSKLSTTTHPIFSMAASEVIKQLPQQATYAAFMAQEDLHLIGTFLLSKLPTVRWEAPLLSQSYNLEHWQAFWLRNIESLMQLTLQIEGKQWSKLPQFSIFTNAFEEGAAPASNLADYIKDAQLVIRELSAPISDEARKLNRQYAAAINEHVYYSEAHVKEIIQKGLQGSLLNNKETKEYPKLVAAWARRVGEFPSAKVTLLSGRKVMIADFWEDILIKGFKLDGSGLIELLVGDVTVGDVEEILEHCTTTILQDGSVMASNFFHELSNVAEALTEFRNPMPSKRVMSTSTSAELLTLLGASDGDVSNGDNFKSLRQTDEHSPKRAEFATMKEYLAARKAYAASKDASAASDSIVNI